MKKRHTSLYEKGIIDIKKTFPTYRLTSYENLARLRRVKGFTYKNKPRLYNEATRNIIQCFEDIRTVLQYLPLSYRHKIFTDPSFHRLMTREISQSLKQTEFKYLNLKKPAETYGSFVMYHNFFAMGLEGLIRSMPTGFQNYLINQIKPLMQFMDSIAFFYRNTTKKFDIPYPYKIPNTIEYKE